MAETSSPKTLEDPNYKAEAYKKSRWLTPVIPALWEFEA